MIEKFGWDTYLKYDELTEFLNEIVAKYPDLAEMESIGKTWQGRDIWCLTLTNKKTGCASRKPALYVDGNTHAGEVTGCMISLYLAWTLVRDYETDPQVKTALDTRTYYIIPRLSADGAETYLTSPMSPRSSIRPWPHEKEQDGLYAWDIDGDGIVAQMRIRDDNGAWRVSEKDPRIMVERKPHEHGGEYYSLFQEGLIRNWNGIEVKGAPNLWGLDVNRNFASAWQQQHMQPGAGPYPFSEPESRAVADFFQAHKNITIAQSFHTFCGAVLRPPASKADKDLSPKDLKALKEIGAIGTECTGYPVVGVYEDFALSKDIIGKRPLWGVALEWMMEHGGVISYSTEVWDLANRALERTDTYKTLMNWNEDEQVLLQKWNDDNLDGEGFINWRPFEHPQLGPVEIGGWKHKYVFQNPPPKFLRQECEKNTRFALLTAATTPEVHITKVDVEKVSSDVFCVKVGVRNMGYLPTNVTDQGAKNRTAVPVKVEVTLSEGASVAGGKTEVEIGHLEGRLALGRAFGGGGVSPTMVQWVVKTQGTPTTISICAGCPRGGYDEKEIVLE